MALNVDGEVACTLIARRSVGLVESLSHLFQRHLGTWTYLGGGGSPGGELFPARPEQTPAGEYLHCTGSAGVRGAFEWRKPWNNEVELRYSPQGVALDVTGWNVLVAAHGNAVLV